METALIDPYAEEEEAKSLTFEDVKDLPVDYARLKSTVLMIRDFVENKAIPHAMKSLVDDNRALRKELRDTKALALEASAATPATGSSVVAAGMVQLGKDIEDLDSAWKGWQTSQTNRAESMGREIKNLREQNKNLNTSLFNWQGEVKAMHSELVQLKAMWENLPGIIQSVVNAVVKALPTPEANITIPEDAIKSLIQVVLPTRLKTKRFTYLDDGRPDAIIEEERDAEAED